MSYPDEVYTSIAGVTFGGRQEIIALAKKHDVKVLYLQREPDNAYDSNAVQVVAKNTQGKLIQLGYLRNKDLECMACGARGKLTPGDIAPETCNVCGSGEISKEGLATAISRAMDDGVSYIVKVEQYTGSDEGKNLGVNIKLERVS